MSKTSRGPGCFYKSGKPLSTKHPRPDGVLTGLITFRRVEVVFCKYPRSLASKTRLKDRIEHLRVNLNVRGFKPLVDGYVLFNLYTLQIYQEEAGFSL